MDLPVVSDGIHLAAYKPRLSLSVPNGKETARTQSDSDYYQCYGDGSNLASSRSVALTGYETLDSPPNYDFYANTEVWGRQRQFRPSLYQLYAKPEVGFFIYIQGDFFKNEDINGFLTFLVSKPFGFLSLG